MADVVVTEPALFDACEIAGPYKGDFAAVGVTSVPNVVSFLSRNSGKEVALTMKPFDITIPGMGTFNTFFSCNLAVSLNDKKEFVLSGSGKNNLNLSFTANGTVDRAGNFVLNISTPDLPIPFKYTAKLDVTFFAGLYKGNVTSMLGTTPNVELTLTRDPEKETTLKVVSKPMVISIPGLYEGPIVLEATLAVSKNDDCGFVLKGSGSTLLGKANSVQGTITADGNLVVVWDFGDFGLFTFTGKL